VRRVDAAERATYHQRVPAPRKERTPQRRAKTVRGKDEGPVIQVRRLHRRDLNKVWEFIKKSFRDVNLETVEYQRPRSKKRFYETYEEEGVEQLLFVVDGEIVAYTECTYEIIGSDTWINPRYFERRDMRPLFVEELAVHPSWHGRGVGSFVLEQIQHLAKVRGLTHLVLEVAENNSHAVAWYRKRGFRKLDASVFMAYAVDVAPELLPPRALEGQEAEPGTGQQVTMVVPVGEGPGDMKRVGRRSAARKAKAASAKPAASKSPSAAKAKAKAKAAPPAARKAATANTTVVGTASARSAVVGAPAVMAKPAAVVARPVSTRASSQGDVVPAPVRAETEPGVDGKNGQRSGRAGTAPPVVPAPNRRRP
jgi:ribosomal protein S18 acetylase RimI-like enzyme